jgi:large-conductance mechanosensitive channel
MHINEFYTFLVENHIISTSIATIFSRVITDLCYSFIDNILLPIINIDVDHDGKADINDLKNKQVDIYGIKLKIGPFSIELIKFLVILFILFLLSKLKLE